MFLIDIDEIFPMLSSEFTKSVDFGSNKKNAKKYFHVNLNRAKSAFNEISRNAWNLSTKSGSIQNLCALSHCTIAYNISSWKQYILHTEFIT